MAQQPFPEVPDRASATPEDWTGGPVQSSDAFAGVALN